MEHLDVLKKDSAQQLINEFRANLDIYLGDSLRNLMEDIERSSYYSEVTNNGFLISRFHNYDLIPPILLEKFWYSINRFDHFYVEIARDTISVYFNSPFIIDKPIIQKWIDNKYNQKDFDNAVIYHKTIIPIKDDEAKFLVVCIAIMIVLNRGIPSEN